jgi:hypothetical protein
MLRRMDPALSGAIRFAIAPYFVLFELVFLGCGHPGDARVAIRPMRAVRANPGGFCPRGQA